MSDTNRVNSQTLEETLEELADFPIPTYEEWRKITEKSLKGGSFEQLLTKTYEGITLKPMYQKQDVEGLSFTESFPGFAPFVRGNRAVQTTPAPWIIQQQLALPTTKQMNEALRHDLARGQTGIHIALDEATKQGLDPDEAERSIVGNKGVSISSVKDLEQLFNDIDVTSYPLFIQTGALSLPFLALMMSFLRNKNKSEAQLKGCIGADPLAALVRNGRLSHSLETYYDALANVTSWANENTPLLRTILVDSSPYHNGGGSAVEELAFTLAQAVEYVRKLGERGLTIDDIAAKMQFSFSIGSNLFMEIAKFRAVRMLWAKIVNAFGGNEEAQKMIIHARTSAWNKTVYDPYVNMLRGTIEAFTGAVSGVDSMHVAPFDELVQTPTEFSRRIARNTQIILQEESHLGKVTDPAGGSWYVEALTNEVAKKAWTLFQAVEAKGGLEQAMRAGFPQEKIRAIAEKRLDNIKKRRETIVGTNRYANPSEESLAKSALTENDNVFELRVTEVKAYRQEVGELSSINDLHVESFIKAAGTGATIGQLAKALEKDGKQESVDAIPEKRGAEPFEYIRGAMDRYIEQHGKRPQVFLANIGPIAAYKARADFAGGFFEVGGYDVLTNNGFENEEETAKAALESGAKIIVISSTDDVYPTAVPKLAKRLKEADPELIIYLAGNPPEEELRQYKQAGIEDVVHTKSNVYDTIVHLHTLKGVIGA